MRSRLLFLVPAAALCALIAVAQDEEPQPGPVPIRAVRVGEYASVPHKGDANTALATFLAAHKAHKEDNLDAALAGYARFLGMGGAKDLPARYTTTVRARLAAMRAAAGARYAKALSLYAKDRAKGLVEFRILAKRYAALPEGEAARKMWHTDGVFDAITKGREAADPAAKRLAATELEGAIKRFPAAVYRHEAKTLLIELGGPDLFEHGERASDSDDSEDDPDDDD